MHPHYLKATNSSESKKMENKSCSGVSWLRRRKSVSRSSRNVGVLIRKASFKPNKEASLECCTISEGVAFSKATHSSALKNSNFADDGGAQVENASAIKFCRYNHCSLHGHRHHDSTYQSNYFLVKRGQYNRRWKGGSPKKRCRVEAESVTVPLYGEHDEAAVDSTQMHDLSLIETVFGETSFPERAHQDSLRIMAKYEQRTGKAFGMKGYCLSCYCLLNDHSEEQVSKSIDQYPAKDGLITDSGVCSEVDSADCGDTKVYNVMDVEDSITDCFTHDNAKLQFSKPGHVSLWKLIHQNFSNSVAESSQKPVAESDAESSSTRATTFAVEEVSVFSKESSDLDTVINSEYEAQDVEDRKQMVVKHVRDAIDKILLPEVQDLNHSMTGHYSNGSECIEQHEKENFLPEKEPDADKCEVMAASDQPEQVPLSGDSGSEVLKGISRKNKAALNHWSGLKKWILLQKFIEELEKVRPFDARSPKIKPLNFEPGAEKRTLRSPVLGGRKSAEEWMLDYALSRVVGQLAPSQKKKVALLVKAFESVVPPHEDTHTRIQILTGINENGLDKDSTSELQQGRLEASAPGNQKARLNSGDEVSLNLKKDASGNKSTKEAADISVSNNEFLEPSVRMRSLSGEFKQGSIKEAAEGANHVVKSMEFESDSSRNNRNAAELSVIEDAGFASKCMESKMENGGSSSQTGRTNHIKMWHMIYQHVVPTLAERVGNNLFDGSETEEVENENIPVTNDDSSDKVHEKDLESNNVRIVLTKEEVVKLIKETVNEILLAREESFRAQSLRDGFVSEEPISSDQRSPLKAETKAAVDARPELPTPRNWSKLKKALLVKRSINALDEARKHKKEADPESDTVKLKSLAADERKKAEQWMLDYTVQHMVKKLTPARKTRVSMLVEAFEAVIPFPGT